MSHGQADSCSIPGSTAATRSPPVCSCVQRYGRAYPTTQCRRALHFGTLVDKVTSFTFGMALPWKCDAARIVHDGLKRLQIITGRTVGRYHSDGARELMMPTLVTFQRAQGTETTTTAAHSPSSNPDPEGKNRAIFNAVRTALTTSGIENRYWTYAAADAANKLNFIPQRQPANSRGTIGGPDFATNVKMAFAGEVQTN
jgi:hypothetical protein